jgi:hypothetical protein
MEEKSDCITNGLNEMPVSNTLTIDVESDPGSWAQALKYSQHIKVIDDEGSFEESR